ncbi:MAG: hypothetical protein IPP72_06805 [Chitinophagaceae bacterium]|nr:hypothetical protein [Chitinophagaceae bacterium]
MFILSAWLLSATAQQKQEPFAGWPGEQLIGTWAMPVKGGKLCEEWRMQDDHTMLGKSYKVSGTDTTLLETVTLTKEGNAIFYIPTAIGQNHNQSVRFKLSSFSGQAYIFENQAHDFPKRIVYEFTGNNTMHAYVDDGTPQKRQEFNYKRVIQ